MERVARILVTVEDEFLDSCTIEGSAYTDDEMLKEIEERIERPARQFNSFSMKFIEFEVEE